MSNPGTPTWLRARNDASALALLLEHGPMSRSQLAALSGMSRPTASQMLTRLGQRGIVAPAGRASGARGPSATTYGVRSDVLTGVAVSIVGEGIDAVLVDVTDTEHPVAHLGPDDLPARSPADDIRAAIRAACAVAGADPTTVSTVNVGVQAAVDVDADRLSCADTLPGWPMAGAAAIIADATGVSVRLENDVNLAARAERATDGVRDLHSFAYLWLGQGLGVGLDIDGIVRRGAFSSAGEIGYLKTPRSAVALDDEARDFTDLMGGAAMVRLLGGGAEDTLIDVLPRLHNDDDALEKFAQRVALLISPILTVLDPAAFILGGPTSMAAGPRLAELVRERVASERHPKIEPDQVWARQKVDVRLSRAGDQPILQGARRMLVTDLRERLEARVLSAVPVPS